MAGVAVGSAVLIVEVDRDVDSDVDVVVDTVVNEVVVGGFVMVYVVVLSTTVVDVLYRLAEGSVNLHGRLTRAGRP